LERRVFLLTGSLSRVSADPEKGMDTMKVCSHRSQVSGNHRAVLSGLCALLLPAQLSMASFDSYAPAGSFQLPIGTAEFDALDDGRLIAVVDEDIYVEDAAESRTFSLLGTLPAADIGFGAAFIRVSPDNLKIAVGNNGGLSFVDFEVGVFELGTLSGTWFVAGHFQAEWINNTQLALTVSDFTNGSTVTVLDTTSSDVLDPINPTIIDNIGGAAGGITFDAGGHLYTGNAFASIGPSDSGTIKAFTNAAWTNALSGGPIINFEAEGTFVIDLLGASPLGFDSDGNLFAGGGSDEPETDAVGLVRQSALAGALAGNGPIDATISALVRRFDPLPANDANFFSADFNETTGELYIRDFGDSTVYVYREPTSTPTLSKTGAAVMLATVLGLGTAMTRRRQSIHAVQFN
jgi:hypothetical protein